MISYPEVYVSFEGLQVGEVAKVMRQFPNGSVVASVGMPGSHPRAIWAVPRGMFRIVTATK